MSGASTGARPGRIVQRVSGQSQHPIYTHGHHESVLRSHRWRTAANSAAYLLPHLRPGQTVLDIGCGPGTITADLAVAVAPGRVLALEPTADALDLARATLAERSIDTVDLLQGDVHALDLPDDSVDVVHAHQVLQHVADPVQALREMARVCRPGGLLAARDADYAGFVWYPGLPGLDAWMALYQRVARANGGEPDAGRHLLTWAHAAGLSEVEPSASIWCYAGDADRRWWGQSWADRSLHSDFARTALSHGLATQTDLQEIAAAWTRWADEPDGWLWIPHGEVLARV